MIASVLSQRHSGTPLLLLLLLLLLSWLAHQAVPIWETCAPKRFGIPPDSCSPEIQYYTLLLKRRILNKTSNLNFISEVLKWLFLKRLQTHNLVCPNFNQNFSVYRRSTSGQSMLCCNFWIACTSQQMAVGVTWSHGRIYGRGDGAINP